TPPSPLRNSLSFYDEGYEVGHACANVRKILAKTNIRRDESKFKENEDNVGFVFTLMNEFIGKFDECEEELFKTIINPNIDEFIEKLYEHQNSEIYKDVAILLNEFIAFERVALNSPKPVKIDHKKSDGLSRSENIRREKNRIRKLRTEGTYAK
ncbi:molecular chaperone TorD family protein, partial [Campylobacter concisus]